MRPRALESVSRKHFPRINLARNGAVIERGVEMQRVSADIIAFELLELAHKRRHVAMSFFFISLILTLHFSHKSSYDTSPLPGGTGGAASAAPAAAAAAAAAAIARGSTGGGSGGRR